MKLSARNKLRGIIRHIDQGMSVAEITIEIAPGVRVVAKIDLAAVFEMNLSVGDYAYAVVETTSIMVTVD